MPNPIESNPLEQFSLEQLRRRTSEKWRQYPQDVLPLFVAEMDAALAEPVLAAVEHAVRTGDVGYAIGDSYAEAFQAFAARRWGWSPQPQATRLVPDVMGGVAELLRWNTRRGDAVVLAPPVYIPFHWVVERTGRRLVFAPLGEDGRHDPEALERAFTEAAATSRNPVFLLCNPQNPTGAAHGVQELETVARLAARHGLTVVSDEIHAPIVLGDSVFTPYLPVAERLAGEHPGAGRAITVTSASKAWNLPGMKAGLAIAGAEARGWLDRLPEYLPGGPSHLGVIAHTAALREGEEWLDRVLAALTENRSLLQELVAEQLPGVRFRPGEASYLAWLDFRELELKGGPGEFFLERARVALQEGADFGPGGQGHARLNFATRQDLLREAVSRMAAALG